jgi:SAM-dependent methyltransferase
VRRTLRGGKYPLATSKTITVAESPSPLATVDSTDRFTRLADPFTELFPLGYRLSPEINEVYELKLAMLEAHLLDPQELVTRGAYFLEIDGKPTNHFRLCTGGAVQLPSDTGGRLRSFLATHQFKSSYATHGLFPYRGKFHPQMVKALLNVMGLKPGHLVLDPMAGSGTTSVEASLLGIDSISVDASPFCAFLATTKVKALSADVSALRPFLANARALGRAYTGLRSDDGAKKVRDSTYVPRGMPRAAFDVLALAFLDARGYAERSTRKSEQDFFRDVLQKYVDTIERFQMTWKSIGSHLGSAAVIHGDARSLDLADGSVDGVLFSPPYSFAIDYLANDASHLRYLGYQPEDLRPGMVGLNPRSRKDQVTSYFKDMRCVLAECARVLKRGRCCTLVVGSNSNQISRALGIDPQSIEARLGIEARLTEIAGEVDLRLELAIRRLIVGISNSMRDEHIVVLRKGT